VCFIVALLPAIGAMERIVARHRANKAIPQASFEVYVDGIRRPDLDAAGDPNVIMFHVCTRAKRAAVANVDGDRLDITML
jgi:hypothetical protein